MNEKFPGGAAACKAPLEQEGFTVSCKDPRYFVENYRHYLFTDFF